MSPPTDTADRNRRRHYWIDPAFQGRYLLRILMLELLVAAVTALISFGVAFVLISPGFSAGSGWGSIFAVFVLMILIVGGLLAWLGVRISHRLCGPVYRMSADLRALREGHAEKRIHLRDGDELQELAREINATLDHFAKRGN